MTASISSMNWPGAFPSLKRRGGCAIKKCCEATFERRRRGGRSHTMFQNAFGNVTCERPPRPCHIGTGSFLDGTATPPLGGGECAQTVQFRYLTFAAFFSSARAPERAP